MVVNNIVSIGSRRPPSSVSQSMARHPSVGCDVEPATRVIDCDQCVARATNACGDCVVTFLLQADDQQSLELDAAQEVALNRLAQHGLVPMLREHRVS
jgi:hypothetical protein